MRVQRAIILFVGLLVGARLAVAESVVVGGTEISVDKLQQVDDESISVTLFGVSEIVSRSELPLLVLKRSLEGDRRLSAEQLQKIVHTSLDTGEVALGAVAVRALLVGGTESVSARDEVVATLVNGSPPALQLVQQVFLSGNLESVPEDLLATLLMDPLIHQASWVQQNAMPYIYRCEKQIWERAKQKIVFAHLDGKADDAQAMTRAVVALFGEEDPRVTTLLRISSRLSRGLAGIREGHYQDLQALVGLLREQPELRTQIGDNIRTEILRSADLSIQQKRPDQALRLLAYAGFDQPGAEATRLASQALDHLSIETESVLRDEALAGMVVKFQKIDPSLGAAYVRALEHLFHSALDVKDVLAVDRTLRQILLVRPDPNAENDLLRIQLGLLYQHTGMQGAALQVLQEIQTSLSIMSEIRLVWYGLLPIPTWYLTLLVPLLLILGFWLYRAFQQGFLLGSPKVSVAPPCEQDEEVDDESVPGQHTPQGFIRANPMGILNPRLTEYRRCLEEFSLQPGASLREIKIAYRAAVKDVHPDTHRDVEAKASERFIHLTDAYERLLKLRKELALDGSPKSP